MRRAIAALLVVLAAAAPARADRASAEFFAGRGEQALKAKTWDDAEKQFRRALEEDATFLPARHGLSQALLGSGRTGPGVEELRAFVAAVEAAADAPAEWKALGTRAAKQLSEVDAAGAELRKILDRYADEALALARKWAAKDARTADAAARRALFLRPGDRSALELLERTGGSSKGPAVSLFNGTDLSGWEKARFPQFQVEEGLLIGAGREGAYLGRTQKEFTGDFDVRCEIRILEEWGPNPVGAVLGTWKGDYDYYGAGVLNRKLWVHELVAEGNIREVLKTVPSAFKGTFDPAGWNLWEIRFRKGEVAVFVNGTELSREARPAARDRGFVGIYIQEARVAFRGVEVQPR